MFRSKLLWRLYTGYVAIILISTLVVGIQLSRQLAANSLEEIQHSLAVSSELLAAIAKDSLLAPSPDSNSSALQAMLVELGVSTESRLTVIATDGRVIADSRELPQSMDNHRQRPEIIDALETGAGIASRYSQTLQQQMMYRAVAVTNNQQTLGFVRVSLPLATIDNRLAQLRLIVLLSAGIVALAALILGFYFAKRFTDPLLKMTEAAEAISQGDYERRITVDRQDEIGQLAAAFNRMARSSAQRMTEITLDHNRLSNIFAGMVEGVIDVDQQQKIIHINQVAADLLGLSVTNCINQPIWEQVRVTEIINALEQALETREVVKAQMRRSTEEDDLVVDIYAAALQNEKQESIGAVIVLHNISELDHLERIRRDFVANASHELKTPITAIRGLTETILDDADMPENIRHDFIERVHAQSLRLSSLVTDLMTISRLESDHQEKSFHVFDLVELVRRSAVACKAICLEKQLDLALELPNDAIMINGDNQAISQLVDNLVDNATKYTNTKGSIKVSLCRKEGQALLTVKDSGIGISPQLQQRIFERFYRVDKARSRELGGTGLGLSIVNNIAEQHGGTVSVESQLAKGSTFIVALPLENFSENS
ncbi:MAG: HAMP domain-containing protein [Pseudohongiella sp.]|nr:HAMP domain-containing protein [Pseudohongiella sp.]